MSVTVCLSWSLAWGDGAIPGDPLAPGDVPAASPDARAGGGDPAFTIPDIFQEKSLPALNFSSPTTDYKYQNIGNFSFTKNMSQDWNQVGDPSNFFGWVCFGKT